MRNIRLTITALILSLALLTIHAAPSFAVFGLEYYWIEVVDADGDTITSDMTFEIQDTSGDTETVYTNKNSTDSTVTNPDSIADTSNPGVIAFYYNDSYDLKLTDGDGNYKVYEDLTRRDTKVVFEKPLTSQADLKVSGGIINVMDSFNTVAAKSATKHDTIEIATSSIVGSTVTTGITQSAAPRNVQVIAVFDSNNATATITASLLVEGTNARGVADTETISFSTTSAQGNKAWASISTFTITTSTYTVGADATKVTYNLGNHDKLGLSNNVTLVGDVINIRDNTSDITPSASNISTTYNTYTPSTTPSDTNYDIRYKVKER